MHAPFDGGLVLLTWLLLAIYLGLAALMANAGPGSRAFLAHEFRFLQWVVFAGGCIAILVAVYGLARREPPGAFPWALGYFLASLLIARTRRRLTRS